MAGRSGGIFLCAMVILKIMALVASVARASPWLTRTTGVLLSLLGVIHLVATPFYIGWSARTLANPAPLVIAGMKLNHILTGILLLPLGLSTFWAGKALHETWAIRLAATNAVVTLLLPVFLVLTMPTDSLDAPLFRLAILVLTLACLTQIGALGGVMVMRHRQTSENS